MRRILAGAIGALLVMAMGLTAGPGLAAASSPAAEGAPAPMCKQIGPGWVQHGLLVGFANMLNPTETSWMYAAVNGPYADGACGSPGQLNFNTPDFVGDVWDASVTLSRTPGGGAILRVSGTALGTFGGAPVEAIWTADQPTVAHARETRTAPGGTQCTINSVIWTWDNATAELTLDLPTGRYTYDFPTLTTISFSRSNEQINCR